MAAAADLRDYPAREIPSALATACSRIEKLEGAGACPLAAGWDVIAPEPQSVFGPIVAFGFGSVAASGNAALRPVTTLCREVRGREVLPAQSGVSEDRFSAHACQLHEVATSVPPGEQKLSRWTARKPETLASGLPGGVGHVRNPGLKPGPMQMEASFVPPGARLPPPLESLALFGIVFSATAIEFTLP
ncbi:MAG: hypothetical protein N2423_06175 [Novosphingobium sp.]|nr:hypothetical protein [Novosphingobium sp.]